LCRIRGNLKEYACHKIDKRIDELLRKKSRKRQEEARNAELENIEKTGLGGKYVPWDDDQSSYTKASSYGKSVAPPLGMEGSRGPTLPNMGEVDIYAPVTFANPYGNQGLPPPQYQQPQYQQQYYDTGYQYDTGYYAPQPMSQSGVGSSRSEEESVVSGGSSPILRSQEFGRRY
jgi:hypothetical protein